MFKPLIHEYYTKSSSAREHILLHIAEPTEQDINHGLFFATASLPSDIPHTVIEEIQDLIDLMERQYFATNNTEHKTAFEICTETVNSKHPSMVKTLLATASCVIGVIHGKKIAFIAQGDDLYVDLFAQEGEHMNHTPLAPTAKQFADRFSAVTEGAINSQSLLHIASFQAYDVFSPERMLKLIKQFPANELADHIQKSLGSIKSIAAGGMLLTTKKIASSEKKQPVHGATSMNSLKEKEQLTAQTLRPSIMKTLTGALSSKEDTAQSNTRQTRARKRDGDNTAIVVEKSAGYVKMIGKALLIALAGIALSLKHILVAIVSLLRTLYYLITNAKGKRSQMLYRFKEYYRRKRLFFQSLPVLSKVLLVAAIGFSIIFISSIFYLRYTANIEVQRKQAQTTLAAVELHLTDAKSASIYGNDEEALQRLQQAEAQYASISKKDAEALVSYESIGTGIHEMLKTIRKVHTLESSVVLTDSSLNSYSHIEQHGEIMIAFDPEEQSYAKFVPFKDATVSKIPFETLNGVAFATIDETNLITATANGVFAKVTPDNGGLSSVEIAFPIDNVILTSIGAYGGKLYSLSSPFAIYKHSKTQLGYDRGLSWIRSIADPIESPKDIAIDGSIYVLTPNSVHLFLKGSEQSFRLGPIDPPLSDATALWTSAQSDYLYILEPSQARILVFTKSGSFVAQLTSVQWDHPTDMIINETDRTITVIDGEHIYQISFLL